MYPAPQPQYELGINRAIQRRQPDPGTGSVAASNRGNLCKSSRVRRGGYYGLRRRVQPARPENGGRGKGKGKPTGGRRVGVGTGPAAAGRGIDGWVVGTWGTSNRALLAALARTDGRGPGGGWRVHPPAGAGGSQVHAARPRLPRRVRCGAVRCRAVPSAPVRDRQGGAARTAARRAQRRGAWCVRGAGARPHSMLRPEAGWPGFLCPPVARHGHEPTSRQRVVVYSREGGWATGVERWRERRALATYTERRRAWAWPAFTDGRGRPPVWSCGAACTCTFRGRQGVVPAGPCYRLRASRYSDFRRSRRDLRVLGGVLDFERASQGKWYGCSS